MVHTSYIFTVKSITGKYELEGKLFVLQEYDLSKFFDKEVLEDVMDTLHTMQGIHDIRKHYTSFFAFGYN